MEWEVVIGLEVHAQLSTKSKMFSSASTAYGATPNTQIHPLDVALPGTLPVVNKEAVEMAIKLGLAIGANVAHTSVFERKNYFYPDLPKGYQISQYEFPIVERGHLEIALDNGETKVIGITRAHLEEDAGKSLHEDFHGMTGIDLNRAGTPLLEIVSEPDLRSSTEAVAYLKKLHSLVRYLGVCDGNMQEGSFRCDANVSIRPKGDPEFGTRTEIKNLNSFKFVEKAIEVEIERHKQVKESGGTIIQSTMLYDSDTNKTRVLRTKEDAHDYRYFPDPDLLPVILTQAWIDRVKAELPELPEAKKERFIEEYSLSAYDAMVLTASKELSAYYENVVKQSEANPKICANWVMGDLAAALNKENLEIQESPVSDQMLAGLVKRIEDKTISGKIAKTVFEALWNKEGQTADEIIEQKSLKQITDPAVIEAMVEEIMQANPKQLEQYRSGKDKLFQFFVGQMMKKTQGKANPELVNEILQRKLKG